MPNQLSPSDPRRSSRTALDASVSLRRAGQRSYRAKVVDASPHGCRVDFVERPALEERLWIRFAGLQPIEAEVCWIDGFCGGLNFVQPIHPAVFGAIVSRFEPR